MYLLTDMEEGKSNRQRLYREVGPVYFQIEQVEELYSNNKLLKNSHLPTPLLEDLNVFPPSLERLPSGKI